MIAINKADESVNTPLKFLLPPSKLDNLIPPFASLFDVDSRIGIYDLAGELHYGSTNTSGLHELCVPLLLADGTHIGEIRLCGDTSDEQLENAINYLARCLSEVASEVWRRRQLSDEVLERYDELNLIYDLSRLISSQRLSQDEIVKVVLEQTNRIIKASAGVIYLYNDTHTELVPLSFFGEHTDIHFWQGRTREFALSMIYAYEDTQLSDGGNVICAPLRYEDDRLGALVLMHTENDRQFSASDVSLLTALTHNTALFIQAARFYDSLMTRNQELEQTLIELQSTRDELSRAERLSIVGQTVSGLVHDMRAPLNLVMGYAGMLQEGGLSEGDIREFAAQIIHYITDFSQMAQEVLDYTRADEKIQIEPVALDEYLARVQSHLNPPGLRRKVEVVVNAEKVQGYHAMVDAVRFMRVFQNLVNNAVDAIEQHGGTQVTVDAVATTDKMIRFSVTDDGPGIPQDILDRIFEPFITGKPHGTGLGLPIVSRMVAQHGGTIHYENAPGGGACFVFTVPQA